MRFFITLVGLVWFAVPGRADQVEDLARIHIEVMGGRERIEKLAAMRVTGEAAVPGGKKARFTMIAARPAKVRLETEGGGRTLVQGTDGVEPPWEYDTGSWPPKYKDMAAANAKTFAADAEFDDPLVAGKQRGYVFDYAGEVTIGGRKLTRILVTRKLSDTFSIFVDPQTFFIVMRVAERTSAGGRSVHVATHYEDFRPVEGVLLPHLITLTVDGRPTQQTKITRIDPNPKVTDDMFARPKVALPATGAKPTESGGVSRE